MDATQKLWNTAFFMAGTSVVIKLREIDGTNADNQQPEWSFTWEDRGSTAVAIGDSVCNNLIFLLAGSIARPT